MPPEALALLAAAVLGESRTRVSCCDVETRPFCKNLLTWRDHGGKDKLHPRPFHLGREEEERTARLFRTLLELEGIHDGRSHATGPNRPAQGGRRQFAQSAQSAASCLNQALNPRTARCKPAQRANLGRTSPEAASRGGRKRLTAEIARRFADKRADYTKKLNRF